MNQTTQATKLLDLFKVGLRAVAGAERVVDQLQSTEMGPRVGIIALGKAAAAMTQGALQSLGPRVTRLLVITCRGHADGLRLPPELPSSLYEAGHPVPDETSLVAGAALLARLRETPTDEDLLVLLSGGASALAETLPAGTTLDELIRLNRWLLGSGLPIQQVNAIRRAVSCIKGGRAAMALSSARAQVLLISDVPDDAAHSIGSGPFAPPLGPAPMELELPDWVVSMVNRAPPMPDPADPCFAKVSHTLIASNRHARHAVAQAGRDAGLQVHDHGLSLQGDAAARGTEIASQLLQGERGLHLWGGETTVVLPAHTGLGGRCETLAVAAACQLAKGENCWLLAAGTDGLDGTGPAAGATVDCATVKRADEEGIDLVAAMKHADTGTALARLGALVHVGPTGTNVMDLAIGLKC